MDLLRMDGEVFERDGVALTGIRFRYDGTLSGGGMYGTGAGLRPEPPAMTEAEFDAFVASYAAENERLILRHLAWALRGELKANEEVRLRRGET